MRRLLGQGVFADVYDLGDGTVVKAYRRQRHAARPADHWTDHDRLVRRLFLTEAETYERLQSEPDVEVYLPRYFGRVDPVGLGITGTAQGAPLSGCGIRLEKIPGDDQKVALLDPDLQLKAEKVIDRILELCGRLNVWDASCFVPGTRADLTLIDFGFWDHLAEYIDMLNRLGKLPPQAVRLMLLD